MPSQRRTLTLSVRFYSRSTKKHEKPTRNIIGLWPRGGGQCELKFQHASGAPLSNIEWSNLKRVLQELPYVDDVEPLSKDGVIVGFLVSSRYTQILDDLNLFWHRIEWRVKELLRVDVTPAA